MKPRQLASVGHATPAAATQLRRRGADAVVRGTQRREAVAADRAGLLVSRAVGRRLLSPAPDTREPMGSAAPGPSTEMLPPDAVFFHLCCNLHGGCPCLLSSSLCSRLPSRPSTDRADRCCNILSHHLCHFWVDLCGLIFLLCVGHVTLRLRLSSDF